MIVSTSPIQRILWLMTLLVLSGCGRWEDIDKAVSAATKRGLEDYSGTLDTANLVPFSYVNEPATTGTLGRTFKFAGPRLVTLNPSSVCRDSLPGQPVSTTDGAVSKFSYSFLQMADQNNTGNLNLSYLGHSGEIKTEIKQKTLLAAKVSLSQILAYPGTPNWSAFETCCKLTGTCGDYVVTDMYQMTQQVKGLAFTEANMQSALQAAGGDPLKTIQDVGDTVNFIHKSTQSTDLGLDKSFWSHFGFRQLPPMVESPLEGVYLSMEPNKVDCAISSSSKVTSLRLLLNNAAGSAAEQMLGYDIAIPAGWEQLKLKNTALQDRVKLTDSALSCRPQKNKTCPTVLELSAHPPHCDSVQDLTRSDWKATLALYIAGAETTANQGYRTHHERVATLVVPSKIKNIPEATVAKAVLPLDLSHGGDATVSTTLNINTGDLSNPQFRVIAPAVNFAQVVVYPPQQKTVALDVTVSSAICADFNLTPVLNIPMQVIVWGKRPGAVDSTIFEVPPVNITVRPTCPAKPKPTASPPLVENSR